MVTAIVSFCCGCFFGLMVMVMALAVAAGRSDDREEDRDNGRLHDDPEGDQTT